MLKVAKHFLILIILLVSLSVDAQFSDGLTLSPKGGVNIFYGDLVDASRASYCFGLTVDKELNSFISARFDITGGNMKGSKNFRETDILETEFKTKYTDVSLGGLFRILDLTSGYVLQRSLNPYLFGSFGFVYYNSENWYGPAGYKPNEMRMQIDGFDPIFKGGLGCSFRITDMIRGNIEYTGVAVLGDLMDGYDRWFENSYTGTKFYLTERNDFYYTVTAGVSFMLSNNAKKSSHKRGKYSKTPKSSQYGKRSGSRKTGSHSSKKRKSNSKSKRDRLKRKSINRR